MLLSAIKHQNYDKLESLCEEQLTLAIASKVYELGVLEGHKFDVKGDLERKDDVTIINHFFVKNVQLQRKLNPCLSGLKVVTSGPNEITYVDKAEAGDDAAELEGAERDMVELEEMLE